MGQRAELVAVVEELGANLIFVQESWPDASTVNHILPNFIVLDRRDRSERPNRGGIIIYARQDLSNLIAFRKAADAERIWCLVQRDSGCVVICNNPK